MEASKIDPQCYILIVLIHWLVELRMNKILKKILLWFPFIFMRSTSDAEFDFLVSTSAISVVRVTQSRVTHISVHHELYSSYCLYCLCILQYCLLHIAYCVFLIQYYACLYPKWSCIICIIPFPCITLNQVKDTVSSECSSYVECRVYSNLICHHI